jgi:hypothetical protein
MSPSSSEIIALRTLDIEMFKNDEGNFPTLITLVIAHEPAHVVNLVVSRMTDLFVEYADTYPSENFSVMCRSAEHIKDKDEDTLTLITPDTLALILNYEFDGDRLITLELGFSSSDFTVH